MTLEVVTLGADGTGQGGTSKSLSAGVALRSAEPIHHSTSLKKSDKATKRYVAISETAFTNQLLQWAKVYGWRRFHTRTSGRMTNGGYAIPTVQGDKGFPDLIMIKGYRMIVAELKVGTNRTTTEQREWIAAFDGLFAKGIEVYEWRPEQWSQILVVLSK